MGVKLDPAVEVWWCGLGCGRELTEANLDADTGACPCGRLPEPLGWRYRNHHGALCYASTYRTLPAEART